MRSLQKILVMMVAVAMAGCQRAEFRKSQGVTWGTTYNIIYRADRSLDDSIQHCLRQIDRTLSAFNAASELSAVNRGDSVRVGREMREVLALSQRVCSISGGRFDPSVAPLINLWGFGYREGAGDVPTDAAIDSALATVGILDCHISPEGLFVKKTPATELNFSAVAKGYGVDLVAEMFDRNGCHDYMVEIGGEIALSGKNMHNDDWKIQIDSPDIADANEHSRLTLLSLTDCGIATSGNYRNYRQTSEGTVAHTISPATGRPVQTDVLSATIIAPTVAEADALATACMASDSRSALAMIDGLAEVKALLVVARGDSLAVVTTADF